MHKSQIRAVFFGTAFRIMVTGSVVYSSHWTVIIMKLHLLTGCTCTSPVYESVKNLVTVCFQCFPKHNRHDTTPRFVFIQVTYMYVAME